MIFFIIDYHNNILLRDCIQIDLLILFYDLLSILFHISIFQKNILLLHQLFWTTWYSRNYLTMRWRPSHFSFSFRFYLILVFHSLVQLLTTISYEKILGKLSKYTSIEISKHFHFFFFISTIRLYIYCIIIKCV